MLFLGLPTWEEIFRGLMALFCKVIYRLISLLYDLFINISKVNILSSDTIQPIYQRVTLILTIIMVFYITFEFVKFIVQPDGISDKEKGAGKIIYKMIAVVVLIAFVPTIFTGAFKLQNAIVDKGIIGKVILGNNGAIENNFGGNFSANVFGMFYSVNEEYANEECEGIPCGALVGMNLKSLREDGHLKYLTTGLNASETTKIEVEGKKQKVSTPYIDFDGLIAVIVGGIIVWILALYCIDVGVRWAQLIFLQVIAPIPIIGYLSPKKDGIFQKWCKQCLTTYVDLFLRIAIIYFVLLICGILLDPIQSGELFADIPGLTGGMETFVNIALILGVLLFAQKAPKMLSELFPKSGAASGNFGLKAGERVAPMAARAIGAGLGATRLFGGAISRGVNTYRRNKEERDKEGWTRKQQREAHKQNKQEYRDAKKAYKQGLRTRNNAIKRGISTREDANKKFDESKVRDDYIKARDKVATDKNKKYRSVPLNVLAGALGGAARGVQHGMKATKLEDIGKNVKSGYDADKKAESNREKWLDSGGGSNIDRIVSGIENRIGITTESGRIERTIKDLSDEIKTNETLISAENDTKAKRDEVEDRLSSKLESGELKAVIGEEEAAYLRKKVKGVDLRAGDTVSTAYKRTKAAAETAKSNLDSIIKEKGVNSAEAMQAQQLYQEAEQRVTDMKKHGMRAAYTQMLKNPKSELNDAVAEEKLETMKSSIKNANRNASTVEEFEKWTLDAAKAEKIKEINENSNLTEAEKRNEIEKIEQGQFEISEKYKNQLKAFKGEVPFEDYDQLDDIITRLKNISDSRMRRNMELKETQRKYESSDFYAAAKADDAAHGGGK